MSTLEELINVLRTDEEAVSKSIPDTTWYLFGSAVASLATAGDIDLLIVCRRDGDATHVRERLQATCLRLPLHLLLMSRDEEAELRFIEGQRCVQIFPTITKPIQ